MELQFTKMHGLGNDFILVHAQHLKSYLENDLSKVAAYLCDRRRGIGADGLILLDSSSVADVRMRIFNADGSEAEMCGNGIRCLAFFAYEQGYIQESSFRVETLGGIMTPSLSFDDTGNIESITVDMGSPLDISLDNTFEALGKTYPYSYTLLGVPHALVYVEDIEQFPVEMVGPILEKHSHFPKGSNINFAQQIGQDKIAVRTWERGAGATLACGTGSCSVAVLSHLLGKTSFD